MVGRRDGEQNARETAEQRIPGEAAGQRAHPETHRDVRRDGHREVSGRLQAEGQEAQVEDQVPHDQHVSPPRHRENPAKPDGGELEEVPEIVAVEAVVEEGPRREHRGEPRQQRKSYALGPPPFPTSARPGARHSRSMIVPVPRPPPQHIAIRP